MILTVGFIPSAYEPYYVTGEQIGERQPHSARVFIRDQDGRLHSAVPVATLYTDDTPDNRKDGTP